jgi:hypothetical protein
MVHLKENQMSFAHVLRFNAASVLVAAALCGCQGDDNVLPLPPDAGSDAHADATAHDGAAEASKDSSSGEASAEPDSSDANAVPTDSSSDTAPSEASASDASGDASNDGAVSPAEASADSAVE